MIPLWLLVALIAEILWVTGNLIDKYLIERYFRADDGEGPVGTLMLFSGFAGFIIALVALFVADDITLSPQLVLLGIALGMLNALWVLLYLYAISKTELSRAIPIFQTVPIFGLLFGFLLLGEIISTTQAVGAFLIITGAVILSYHRKESGNSFDGISLSLMLGAAFIIAFTDVLFKYTALQSSYWSATFWVGIGIGLFAVMLYVCVPIYRRQFNQFVKTMHWQIFAANGINEFIDAAANLVFAAAVLLGPVALVQSTNAYQPFLILIIGLLLSKILPRYYDEDLLAVTFVQKVAGILIITVGSIIIYLSV